MKPERTQVWSPEYPEHPADDQVTLTGHPQRPHRLAPTEIQDRP